MSTSQKIHWLIIFSFLFLAVSMPLELIHGIVMIINPVYMMTEYMLDETISYVFGTDARTTEIIVFYLMMGIGAFIVYALFAYFRYVWTRAKTEIPAWYSAKKTQVQTAWRTSPLIKKMKIAFGIALGGSFAAILALS